jgi:hypothetical protein
MSRSTASPFGRDRFCFICDQFWRGHLDKIDCNYRSVTADPLVVSICQLDFLAARCSENSLDDFACHVRTGSLYANDSSHTDFK